MACNSDITVGRTRSCKNNQGGVKRVILYKFVEDSFTVTDGEATAINPLVTEVFEYEVSGDATTFAENAIGERQNGTSVNTQTATIVLQKQDATTAFELTKLIQGYTNLVIQDRNGVWRVLGLDDGMDFTVDASTGGAKGDLNGYTITGTATTKDLAPILDSATTTALLALLPVVP